jgi:hypothetical protein
MSKFESYKNWINEKFTEDSDPISDLNIGIKAKFDKWIDYEKITDGWNIHNASDLLRAVAYHGKSEFVEYLISQGADIHIENERPLRNAAFKSHFDTGVLLVKLGAYLDYAIDYCYEHDYNETYDGLIKIKKEIKKQKS